MTDAPPRPVIVLGASNVSISLRRILRLLRGGLDGPLHAVVAAGHGRSYAHRTRVFGRSLPGVLRCGAFAAANELAEKSPARPLAVVTDAGNDLLYGAGPAALAGWVAAAVDRLPDRCETVLTLPPLARAARLSAWQYHLARAALFPGKPPVVWPEMKRRAAELHARLHDVAAARGCAVLDPPASWYGADPIHVRRGVRTAAWAEVFDLWGEFTPAEPAPLPPLGRVWGRAAACAVFGRERKTPQPVWRGSGVALSLY